MAVCEKVLTLRMMGRWMASTHARTQARKHAPEEAEGGALGRALEGQVLQEERRAVLARCKIPEGKGYVSEVGEEHKGGTD